VTVPQTKMPEQLFRHFCLLQLYYQ